MSRKYQQKQSRSTLLYLSKSNIEIGWKSNFVPIFEETKVFLKPFLKLMTINAQWKILDQQFLKKLPNQQFWKIAESGVYCKAKTQKNKE